MGRLPLYSQRINCRISKRAGQILNEALDRTAASWKKKPVGKMLTLLIMKTPPETWEAVLKLLPQKEGWALTVREQKRRQAQRQIDAASLPKIE
jgi:hypothetical protein